MGCFAKASLLSLGTALAASACGGNRAASPTEAGTGNGADASTDHGSAPRHDGGGVTEAASGCAPAIPKLAWKSPYAGFSRGIPTDPSFFPVAVWLQGSWHATELSKLGINVYVGNNGGTDALMPSDLAILKGLGMYAIIGQDSVGLASKDDPTVIGWWMTPDEPDNAQSNGSGGYGPPVDPSVLVKRYESYRAADPTRPVWLGLGQGVAYDGWEGRGSGAPPESSYVPASDVVSFDIYPYNNCGGDTNEKVTCSEFWLNAFGVDRLHTWSNRHQAVWSDFEATVINAGTTAGPTPEETRSEVWLALIHEANGICYFIDSWNPSFREDAIFETPAMVTAVTALNAQIKSLAPLLNSASIPDRVAVTSSSEPTPIDVMVKAQGTTLYVFAALARHGTASGTFVIKGLSGSGVAAVVGESRTLAVKEGKFSDSFPANGVHIYSIDLSKVTCP